METRGVVAEYEPGSGRYTLWTPSQGVGSLLAPLARSLGVAESRIRVITNDVGGAFGIKIPPYPEHVLAAWAARRLGRPVKWIADRSESFLSDGQGRDHVTEAELALDAQGRFLAVRARTVSNMGAYTTMAAPTIPTVGGSRCITGVYRIPAWHARSRVVFTNTVPVHAYRGAGKPEYNHMIERLVDAAARETGRDPAELRRLNVVPPEAMPYSTGTGIEFDSGEFAANMDDALALADRPGFEARREEARARGKLRGLGFALFQEPDGFLDNRVTLVFRPSGELTVTLTGQAGGHGHETTFAQVASDRLGVGFDSVRVVQGDSDVVGPGNGSGGSRTATVASMGVVLAADAIVERGRRIAAELMEASAEDVAFADGLFTIAGTNLAVTLGEVVAASFRPGRSPTRTRSASRPPAITTRRHTTTLADATSARSRSTRRPARWRWCATPRSTITGWPSTRCCWKARFTAASRRAWGRRSSSASSTTPTPASSSPAASWTTASHAPVTCRHSGSSATACPPAPIPWGSRVWANRDVRRPARR